MLESSNFTKPRLECLHFFLGNKCTSYCELPAYTYTYIERVQVVTVINAVNFIQWRDVSDGNWRHFFHLAMDFSKSYILTMFYYTGHITSHSSCAAVYVKMRESSSVFIRHVMTFYLDKAYRLYKIVNGSLRRRYHW